MTIIIAQAACLALIVAWDVIGGRRVHRAMRAQHGTTGITRTWIGSDGRTYAYCLDTGRTVDVASGRTFRT